MANKSCRRERLVANELASENLIAEEKLPTKGIFEKIEIP